jgi:hypothetical protein
MGSLRARKRISSRDVAIDKDLLTPFGDSDKPLRASPGRDVYVIMPLELGRGMFFFDKSQDPTSAAKPVPNTARPCTLSKEINADILIRHLC